MILEILIIMAMFLWFLNLIPFPPLSAYGGSKYLAFIVVLLIVLYIFVPALRG